VETTKRRVLSLILLGVLGVGLLRLLPERAKGVPRCASPVGLEEGGRVRVVCLEGEEADVAAVAGAGGPGSGGERVRGGDLVVTGERGGPVVVLPGALPVELRLTLGLKVDVNAATAAELEALPRIGSVLARRIVLERERGGPYASTEDLRRVKGIGPATVRRLSGLVSTGALHAP
jgi:competence ComEA-like helix-hairpin-helix protein